MKAAGKELVQRVCAFVMAVSAALFVPVVLGGCNTVEGVGEDMQAVGSAIDETAEDAN